MADNKFKLTVDSSGLKNLRDEIKKMQSELGEKAGQYSAKYTKQADMITGGVKPLIGQYTSHIDATRSNIDSFKAARSGRLQEISTQKSAYLSHTDYLISQKSRNISNIKQEYSEQVQRAKSALTNNLDPLLGKEEAMRGMFSEKKISRGELSENLRPIQRQKRVILQEYKENLSQLQQNRDSSISGVGQQIEGLREAKKYLKEGKESLFTRESSSFSSSIDSSQNTLRELVSEQKSANESLKRIVDQGKFEAQRNIAEDRREAKRETSEFFSMSAEKQRDYISGLGGDPDIQRRRLEFQRDEFNNQRNKASNRGLLNTGAMMLVADQALRKGVGAYSGATNGLEAIAPVAGGVGAGIGYALGGGVGARIGQTLFGGAGELATRTLITRDEIQRERNINSALSGNSFSMGGGSMTYTKRKNNVGSAMMIGEAMISGDDSPTYTYDAKYVGSQMSEYGYNASETAKIQREVMMSSLNSNSDMVQPSVLGYAQGQKGLGLSSSQMNQMMTSMRMRRSSGNLQGEMVDSFNRFANAGFGNRTNRIGFGNYLNNIETINSTLSQSTDFVSQGRSAGVAASLSQLGGAFNINDPRFASRFQAAQSGLSSGDQYQTVRQLRVLNDLSGGKDSLWELMTKKEQGLGTAGYLAAMVNDVKRGGSETAEKMILKNQFPELSNVDINRLYAGGEKEIASISAKYSDKGINAKQLAEEANTHTTKLQKNEAQIYDSFEQGMYVAIARVTKAFGDSLTEAALAMSGVDINNPSNSWMTKKYEKVRGQKGSVGF